MSLLSPSLAGRLRPALSLITAGLCSVAMLSSCSSAREGERKIAHKWRNDYRLPPATTAKAPAAHTARVVSPASALSAESVAAPETMVLEQARLSYAAPRPALAEVTAPAPKALALAPTPPDEVTPEATPTAEQAAIARAQALLTDRDGAPTFDQLRQEPTLAKSIEKLEAQQATGRRISTLAIIAFVLALLAFLGFLAAPIAFIAGGLGILFGAIALGRQNRNRDTEGGKGLSIAAIVLGIIAVVAVLAAGTN